MHTPVPTPQQLEWQRSELSLFIHFGVNTFTNREWGTGTESPSIFAPKRLNARQWAAVARDAGFRYVILTAKHHDGFCLWPSRYTQHSVRHSSWRGGRGDVVREFVDACRWAGLKPGLYLSPWDRHEPTYGDSPAYNRYFINQLTELLTQYGSIAEVWFDGACGEGPNGKRQEYDWTAFHQTVRRLQPDALIAICGPDIRWVGNEDGLSSETQWSPTERDGQTVWYPAECDVSIRPGWFYHQSEDAQVKRAETLVDLYFRSVGRNAVLLVNIPPDRNGLFARPDVEAVRGFRRRLDTLFRRDICAHGRIQASSAQTGHPAGAACDPSLDTYWLPAQDDPSPALTVTFDAPQQVSVVHISEAIQLGQRIGHHTVSAYVDGSWQPCIDATTVGHKRLHRIQPISASALRLVIPGDPTGWAINRFAAYTAAP